jgi:hypothetical protein
VALSEVLYDARQNGRPEILPSSCGEDMQLAVLGRTTQTFVTFPSLLYTLTHNHQFQNNKSIAAIY